MIKAEVGACAGAAGVADSRVAAARQESPSSASLTRHGRHLFPDRRADRQRHFQSARLAPLHMGLVRFRASATSVASNARSPTPPPLAPVAQSGFVQSDVAFWAYTGTASMTAGPRSTSCAPSPISIRKLQRGAPWQRHQSVADLRGKRVSLDEPGSGTLSTRV